MRRRLWDDLGTALLALLLSLVVWVNATYQNDRPREDYYGEQIPIQVLNAPVGLTVAKAPADRVRVRVKAFASSWAGLTADSFRATVDWKGLAEGVHQLPIRVTCSDRTVTVVSKQPDTIYVELERLQKAAITVTVELQDKDTLPLGYSIEPPDVTPRFVSVEGPASLVGRVRSIVAPVSIAGQRSAVERDVQARAVDEDGATISGVKLAPQTVKVQVDITKKLNYREVAVRARTKGHPARGYFVSSVNVEPSTVTVVGPPAAIAAMSGLVSTLNEVDITDATRLTAERLDLDLPEGVSVFTDTVGSSLRVLVTVEVDAVKGGTTVELALKTKKLRDGLVAKLSVPAVDVILTGPAVLIDSLETDLLDAYVDLGALGVGTHQVRTVVDVLVAVNPRLSDLKVTSISPEFIEVEIQEVPTPTPTSTPSPQGSATVTPFGRSATTPAATATPTVSATPTPTATATTTRISLLPTAPPTPNLSL